MKIKQTMGQPWTANFGLRTFSACPHAAGRRMFRVGCSVLFFFTCLPGLFSVAVHGDSIINSVHNLSVNGPGTIKASSEQDACVFCHTVHHASGVTPLWNHSLSSVSNYVVYASDRLNSLKLTIPQPNGSSRLCLSCHDGTVALGSVTSGAADIQMQNDVRNMPSGDVNNLGTDLRSDHPISFVYDSALAATDHDVADPDHLSTKAVRMDSQHRLQCTSCHDPHNNKNGNFLVVPNDNGTALCLVCHTSDSSGSWGTSAHAISTAAAPLAITSRFAKKTGTGLAAKAASTAPMSAFGCENCHVNHKAGSRSHLLQAAAPEQNCFVCHNGVTSKKNLVTDFQKPSIHPVAVNSQAHTPVEDPINPKTRHVVCADCHNSHVANAKAATAPNASGPLAGLVGVSAAGGVVRPLLKEYELCFRCHADSIARGPALVSRQFPETNTRLQFSPANRSFHPVETIGRNQAAVPSLISPWTVGSLMYCTDCHNSDTSPKAGGSGANGPHGSIYRPILERNLVIVDGQAESGAAYALCYKCHDRNRVLSGVSFSLHAKHVVDDKTACTTCHDSHGVAAVPHLVNFNTTYVTNSSLGVIRYVSAGMNHGNCTLSCHGKDHKNLAY